MAAQLCMGIKRERLSPGKIRVVLPWGFPYEAYGCYGVVKPWHILNLVESGRALTFNRVPNYPGDPYLHIEDLYKGRNIFQASARLIVAKEMYDTTIPKTPLTLEKELVYVGKSSFNIHTDVILPSQGLILGSCQTQSVLVDEKTKRPSPFPEWWRERYGGFSSPEQQLKVQVQQAPKEPDSKAETRNHGGTYEDFEVNQDFPVADHVTFCNMMVASSEIDGYGHANWTSFLKYCVDAMMTGNSPEARHILQRQALKLADIAFVKEASLGQTIVVTFWKDANVPSAVHFNIVDSNSGQLISYARLQFYSLREVTLPVGKL
ncbi:hypothetical protein ACOMHN_053806 [Nucella lapillus]